MVLVMHLDVYKWIWFKLSMIMDSPDISILILVSDLHSGHRGARRQSFLCELSHKVFY